MRNRPAAGKKQLELTLSPCACEPLLEHWLTGMQSKGHGLPLNWIGRSREASIFTNASEHVTEAFNRPATS